MRLLGYVECEGEETEESFCRETWRLETTWKT